MADILYPRRTADGRGTTYACCESVLGSACGHRRGGFDPSVVDIQAAAQKWVDSSISKTANVPTDYRYDDFKDIYLYAHEQGLKGCTTFRFNPEAFQGVLVKEEDLKNTTYVFTLDDGTEVELKGDQQIEYDGEMHTAANLFDALKEGYYGKF